MLPAKPYALGSIPGEDMDHGLIVSSSTVHVHIPALYMCRRRHGFPDAKGKKFQIEFRILYKAVAVISSTSLNRFPLRLLFIRGSKEYPTEPDQVSTMDEAKVLFSCLSKTVELSKLSTPNYKPPNCPPLKLLQQPPFIPKPNISPYIPSTSTSSSQADLLTSTSPIAAISESEPGNPIPNNVPSTSNISAFPSNSGVRSSSASPAIQDAKQKAIIRLKKEKRVN
ncbi:hypothetical protein TNCV_4059901 [Trichonephila clavipes]|nr:hypothetical protein TNCV_4059901 [Trichonephila clavipes]